MKGRRSEKQPIPGADDDDNDDALSLCVKARKLWLQNATTREDLDHVENLYRQALNSKQEVIVSSAIIATTNNSTSNKQKHKNKRKRNTANAIKEEEQSNIKSIITTTPTGRKTTTTTTICATLSKEEYRKAAERLSLLYLQSGRSYKATMGLKYLKFDCRLSERILNYPTTTTTSNKNNKKKNTTLPSSSSSSSFPPPPCCVDDDFLSKNELHHLRKVFEDTSSSYWKDHDYIIDKEPSAPYFSYVIDLKQEKKQKKKQKKKTTKEQHPPPPPPAAFLRTIIDKILSCESVSAKFPKLRHDARYVELWAHNRPHASGHQLHFDSDDEGRSTVPKHPIVSTVLYLSSHSKIGGPTLVTNQRLRNPTTTNLNSVCGWLVSSKPSRLVCFDGSVLHGVIPVSLMMAFWKDIKIRPGTKPGSARPWPTTTSSKSPSSSSSSSSSSVLPSWAIELNRTDINDVNNDVNNDDDDDDVNANKKEGTTKTTTPQQAKREQTIPIRHVYENLDGTPVPKYNNTEDGGDGFYMPEYDRVFQGF
ncbi:hypothetical protein FRACYDRAFT_251128 [Fragilariopsis cylindrus CCMP1102]|uniref:Uncharacterized protein n=1 Tax=Fragilariopsis cylindrus CCMP1102 TaxID=635003 RepID=A0A1E7EP60_9STRA|nr:hypothetical protein FRACYDRAFT_251128 [Fragilariopsis cylindrus CCMP1102]|eukprot:OEU07323.1 hypothetical protein FRACYDRAFT_251128 [Fragilariopsis cylindrus CCMP1102]